MRKFTFLLMAVLMLNCFVTKAQIIDDTGLFEPPLTGGEIVYAELSFVDGEKNGTYDAIFTMSDPEIYAWGDYATCIMFYSGASGLSVRDEGNVGIPGSYFTTGSDASGDVFKSGHTVYPGQRYQFWITLNVPNKTYSVAFKEAFDNSEPKVIVSNAAFRNQSTEIKRWSAVHNKDAQSDTVTVHNVTVVNSVGNYPADYASTSTLEDINLSVGSLDFSSATTTYNVTLPKGTTSVNVEAIPTAGTATVTGAGDINVSSGSATATIRVVSQDNSTNKTYTINFTVEAVARINTLADLTVNGTTVTGFLPDVQTYYYPLRPGASIPTVSATATDPVYAQMAYQRAAQLPGKTVVTVTAESGDKLDYTIYFGVNQIANWDGNGTIGSGSKPDENGWAFTGVSQPAWSQANETSGVRYADPGNSVYNNYTFNGSAYNKNRIMWIRWSSNDKYTYPLNGLESCKAYRFSFKYAWHNNSDRPTLTFGVYKKDGALVKEMSVLCNDTKQTLEESEFLFIAPDAGDYYIAIGNNRTGDCMVAIADLAIIETDEELPLNLTLSTNQIILVDGVAENKTFGVAGIFTEDVELSAPAGFSLSRTTIPVSEFECMRPVQVTVTATEKSDRISGKIAVTIGSGENMLTDSVNVVFVSAAGTNLIPFAMGAGEGVLGDGTEPSEFGWAGMSASEDPIKISGFAAAGAGGGNRYAAVNNYMYSSDANDLSEMEDVVMWNEDGKAWVLFLRWDGNSNSNSDSLTIYNYPVELEAGESYRLTGKYAWHDNGENNQLSFGINTAPDNSGTMLKEANYEDLNVAIKGIFMDIVAEQFERGDFVFTAPTTGTYYLTVYQNPMYATAKSAVLVSLMDLKIANVNANSVIDLATDNIKIYVNNRYIKVEGVEDFKVYTVTGMEVSAKSQLNTGIYLVSVHGKAYKVLVK